eukprot:7294894-Prorocentrum_lima.AAC.1
MMRSSSSVLGCEMPTLKSPASQIGAGPGCASSSLRYVDRGECVSRRGGDSRLDRVSGEEHSLSGK